MKKYNEIKAELKENRARIDALKAEVKHLNFDAEIKAAIAGNNYTAVKDLHNKAKANAERTAEAEKEIFILEIKHRFLNSNARAALFEEAIPAIIEALKPYARKPYGEKTRAKIREEVKKAGYSFYFDGSRPYRVEIALLKDGYTCGETTTGHAINEGGLMDGFITDDNKINIANVSARCIYDYTEDADKAAREASEAINNYIKAAKDLEEQRTELARILPDGIPAPDYIKSYYIHF